MNGNRGFTLVELAVVIAIIVVLAAVALPRLINAGDSAEKAVASDFISKLNSAAAIYTARQGVPPARFSDFVKQTALSDADPQTISAAPIGKGGCSVRATTIVCARGVTFDHIRARYVWRNGAARGVIN